MRGLRIYLISGGILLIIYLIAQLNKPKQIDWTESLSNKEKTPYGTYILYDRLHDIFPRSQVKPYDMPVYNAFTDDSIKNSSYIIICKSIDLSNDDYAQLKRYIQQGNDVFIASDYFGRLFTDTLGIDSYYYFDTANSTYPLRFVNPAIDSSRLYLLDKGIGNNYFNVFDTSKAVVLSVGNGNRANFIKMKFGKGALYLSANPRYFTNYSLLKPAGADYAATALSYIKNTKRIIWDEFYSQGEDIDKNPMRVFLKTPVLQWAYYISIFSLLLFVLYEIKRRQRIIPVIEPLPNSTLDFVNVVGQLYYEKRNNADIAHKQIIYILTYLRDEYQIKTSKLDEEFTEKLIAKVGLSKDFAGELVNYLKDIDASNHISDAQLIRLNKLIEQFYKQSR
jgi:hypothetical protein